MEYYMAKGKISHNILRKVMFFVTFKIKDLPEEI